MVGEYTFLHFDDMENDFQEMKGLLEMLRDLDT